VILGVLVLYLNRADLAAIVVAAVGATAVERYRQSHRPRPLPLAATPREWWRAVDGSVGWRAATLALCLVGAASFVLTRTNAGPTALHVTPSTPPSTIGGGLLPLPAIHDEVANRAFALDGARFLVVRLPGASGADGRLGRFAARGFRWVGVLVKTTNLDRRGFDPNDLQYRLHDDRGEIYYPAVQGGTGPQSLSSPGLLRPMLTAESRLGFEVPANATGLALVFEPAIDGADQVRVRLPPAGHARGSGVGFSTP
jgi:hypothetical protein